MAHDDVLIDHVNQASIASSEAALRSWQGQSGLYVQRMFGVDPDAK